MSHKFHIVTPFSRPENFKPLADTLRNFNIIWHIIQSDIDPFIPPAEDWIKPIRCYVPALWDPCYYKLNYFIQTQSHIHDDLYLMQFCDDDSLPDNFFHRIMDESPEVGYVVSANNGHNVPQLGLRHPARLYEARPDNMFLGKAGSCRPIVYGKYLHALLYPNSSGADQITLCAFTQRFKGRNSIAYITKTAIMFNYYERGRWNKPNQEPKKDEKINSPSVPYVGRFGPIAGSNV